MYQVEISILYLENNPVLHPFISLCEQNMLIQAWKTCTSKLVPDQIHKHSLTLSVISDFCHLLLVFENSLDQDPERHIVNPDLDSNRFPL